MIEIDHSPDDKTTALPPPAAGPAAPVPPRRRRRLGLAAIAAIVGAFAVGAGLSALLSPTRSVNVVALSPAPIAAMANWSPVAIKGQVAEVFGNKFVLQDDSGRALVETGPAGEGGGLVQKAETLTVQGRFEHGFVHAEAVIHADGRADLVGPPRHGPLAWGGGPRPHWLTSLLHPDA